MSVEQENQEHSTAPESQGVQACLTSSQATEGARVHERRFVLRPWQRLYRWFLANSFTPIWLPRVMRHPALGYLVAILLQVVAVFVTMLLMQLFPTFSFTGLLEALAIALVALSWGAGPSLIATLAGALLLSLFVQKPPFFASLNNIEHITGVLLFVVVGLAISIVAGQAGRARRKAEGLAETLATERARLEMVIEHDISKLRHSEQEIANRASELEAIFDTMADSVFVYGLEGHILHMNAAFRELLALNASTQSDYYSLSQEARKGHLTMCAEDGQPLPYDQWPESRILQGEVLKGPNAAEVMFRALDGRTVQISVSGAPVHNREGQLVGALCICRDVTERRQLERRTQDALNALLAMAEALVLVPEKGQSTGELTPATASRVARRIAALTCSVLGCQRVSITAVEPETEILHPVAVVGLSPQQEEQWWAEQPSGTPLSDIPMPELGSRLRANEVLIIDMMQAPFNEQPNPFNVHVLLVAPMCVGDQLVGILSLDYGVIKHDYTAEEIALAKAIARLAAIVIERERLLRERADARANELALREANRRMDEFLGMTGHELKTPLTSIKGNTQLTARQLKNSIQNIQKMQETIMSTERQIRLLDKLVDDLLDISRTQTDHMELNLLPADLTTIVREAVEDQRRIRPTRTITFDSVDATTVPVCVDVDQITQVVTNYLTNALKYSAEDQPVHVILSVQGKEANFSVQDKGPGLAPDEQQQIWERFHRVHGVEVQSSSFGSSAGLGLGLYISKTIIEQHHGRVGVDSTPRVGSTFWFTLPLQETRGAC